MQSPHDLLPVCEPKECEESPKYFYDKVVKPLLADVIRIQSNGIPIDMAQVEQLKLTLESILLDVQSRIDTNPLIIDFQKLQSKAAQSKYTNEVMAKLKPAIHYFKPYKNGNVTHRTWLVNGILTTLNRSSEHKPGWAIKDIRADEQLMSHYTIQHMLAKTVSVIDLTALDAMADLAEHRKAEADAKYKTKSEDIPDDLLKPFNPGSATQKQALFAWLNIESEAVSKDTGLPKWDKEQVERVNKETTDEDVKAFTDAFIEHSQAAIIRNNFISAFDNYVIDGTLYGNFKLFGAKSFRLTSNKPNLLNLPSTGSVFAKPLKKCLVAPPGKVILTADFNALEDRVLAAITKDPGKSAIQLDPELDGHCYNALGYWPEQVEAIIGSHGSYNDKVKRFADIVNSDDHPDKKALKTIRQDSKAKTFKLALTMAA